MSRWGVTTLRHVDQSPLELEEHLQLRVVGPLQHRVLELVDPVVERAQPGEEAVRERVEDEVEELDAARRRRRLHGRPPPQVVERRAGVPVHGDQVARAEEAVDLDQPVLVLVGAVGDDEREVAEGVDLGPLAEVVGVLHGQRVEAEEVAEQREILGRRPVEVEPEELAVLEVPVQQVAVHVVVDAVGVHHERRRLGCCGVRHPPLLLRERAWAARCAAGRRRIRGADGWFLGPRPPASDGCLLRRAAQSPHC